MIISLNEEQIEIIRLSDAINLAFFFEENLLVLLCKSLVTVANEIKSKCLAFDFLTMKERLGEM